MLGFPRGALLPPAPPPHFAILSVPQVPLLKQILVGLLGIITVCVLAPGLQAQSAKRCFIHSSFLTKKDPVKKTSK